MLNIFVKVLWKIIKVFLIFILSNILIILGFLFYIYQIEPQWIELKNVEINLPNLSQEFVGWKIVQVSDIHLNDWMTEKRLKKIVNLVNDQSPDIVVLTGDFFSQSVTEVIRKDGSHNYYRQKSTYFLSRILNKLGIANESLESHSFDVYRQILTKSLIKLKPKYKSFSVLGNHDYATDVYLVEKALADSHIINLKNEVYTFEKNQEMLNIAGLDNISFSKQRLNLLVRRLPEKGTNILLVHEPDFADRTAKTDRFQLQLSGHSHGGQVNIPLIGTPFLPSEGRKYVAGLYKIGNMLLYTNRGVGMAYPYIRFNCRPEITIFTLNNKIVSEVRE